MAKLLPRVFVEACSLRFGQASPSEFPIGVVPLKEEMQGTP